MSGARVARAARTSGRATRAQARTAIFDYLEAFYNPIRRHSSLGNISPAEYERRAAQRAAEPVPA